MSKGSPQEKTVNKRLNNSKIDRHSVRQNLTQDLHTKLSRFDLGANGAGKAWVAFRDTVHDTALTRLGLNTSKHQDWFDDNDDENQKLFCEKRDTHRAHNNNNNEVFIERLFCALSA